MAQLQINFTESVYTRIFSDTKFSQTFPKVPDSYCAIILYRIHGRYTGCIKKTEQIWNRSQRRDSKYEVFD